MATPTPAPAAPAPVAATTPVTPTIVALPDFEVVEATAIPASAQARARAELTAAETEYRDRVWARIADGTNAAVGQGANRQSAQTVARRIIRMLQTLTVPDGKVLRSKVDTANKWYVFLGAARKPRKPKDGATPTAS